MFYLLGFSSSLYHLVLLGQQRIYAINWPIRYKMQEVKSVHKGIGVVWVLSLLSATTPGEFVETCAWFFNQNRFDSRARVLNIFSVLLSHKPQTLSPPLNHESQWKVLAEGALQNKEHKIGIYWMLTNLSNKRTIRKFQKYLIQPWASGWENNGEIRGKTYQLCSMISEIATAKRSSLSEFSYRL